MKLKKYYLIFLVLYLLALVLAGTNRLGSIPISGVVSKTVLSKAWVYIWGLMPSQTVGWWTISLVVLVILIILGFVVGCKLIAFVSRYKLFVFVSDKVRVHFMRKEKNQRRE